MLVITPTVSLIQDQTHELSELGINAMYIGSSQFDPNAETKVFSQTSDVSILFVSSEWLFGRDDKKQSPSTSSVRSGLIAIDEAHFNV